jgi:sugar phosphate isomerase/epimerase
MKRTIGLEHLTLLEISPPELVTLAAAAGFDTVGLETAAALGARYVNVICDDPDTGRFAELLAALVITARAAGVRPVIEFTAYRPISCLADAVAIARQTGGGILLDALHIQRCGVSVDEIAGVDPGLLTYLQLCDAPGQQPCGLRVPAAMPRGQRCADDDRVIEARAMRLLPGEGELPLRALLAALPEDMLVSVEAPSAAALATASPGEYAARARGAVRSLAGI